MDEATAKKIKSDGFLKSMLPGSAYRKEYADATKGNATAAPMGSQSVIDARMKAAGMKNGGLVKAGKTSTPFKVK
jgi:hypothetical protein